MRAPRQGFEKLLKTIAGWMAVFLTAWTASTASAGASDGFEFPVSKSGALSLAVTNAEFQVSPRMEVKFKTAEGFGYWLRRLENQSEWKTAGPQIIGDGEFFRQSLPVSESSTTYRVEKIALANLGPVLREIRERHQIPGMAAAVVRSNQIVALGASGVRKSGVSAPVTITDKFHIGSCAKSMTASLAAMMVEEGKLQWTNRLADIFPEHASGMHADYREVTLQQLLVNRGGAPHHDKLAEDFWTRLWNHPGTPQEQRLFLLRELTKDSPASPPGTKFIYSNSGFAIAGTMIEKTAGRPWEELLRERLFQPLGMSSAGFGAPAAPRYIDQPLGHTWKNGAPQPVEPGKDADNPPSIGPGGTVHCSIIDFARYAAWHVAGARGDASLLKRESFERLHFAPHEEDNYAMGWYLAKRPWADGVALTHTGSNNQWFAVMWLAPKRDFAVVVAANMGGDKAEQACDDVAAALIGKFLRTEN